MMVGHGVVSGKSNGLNMFVDRLLDGVGDSRESIVGS